MSATLFVVSCALADFDAGWDALQRRDYVRAHEEFKALAEKGDPDAAVNLGNLYMRGLGVKQDYSEAFDWYRKAADRNHPVGEAKLGILHYYGLGTVKDTAAAAKCFQNAAEQGEASAQSVLGTMLADGEGVPRNLVAAYFWLTLAFDYGSKDAEAARASIVDDMTPGEIAEALERVQTWKREKGIADPGAAAGDSPLGAPESEKPIARKKPKRGASRTKSR